MISPKERREILILLKVMMNEEAWNNIYQFIHKELGSTDKEPDSNSVQEPLADYLTPNFRYLGYTDAEAQEFMEDYEANDGYPLNLSEEEIQELWKISDECDKHPENLIPFEVVMNDLKEKYGFSTEN